MEGGAVIGAGAPLLRKDHQLIVGSFFQIVDYFSGKGVDRPGNDPLRCQGGNIRVGHKFIRNSKLPAPKILDHQQREIIFHIVDALVSHHQLIQLVHIPSVAATRSGTGLSDAKNRSEGYLVRVYEDCIVFEGYDFVNNQNFAYATYIIAK